MNDFVPTWEDPLGANAWTRLNWEGMEELHGALTMIVAISPQQQPTAIGTGFVISRFDGGAVCVTAAHNFYRGIHQIQFPYQRHHPSTPAEFQTNFERVELAQTRAIFRKGNDTIFANIIGAFWDKHRDLCVFEVEPCGEDRSCFDPKEIRIAAEHPRQGQIVAIIGYAGIENSFDGHELAGMIKSRLEVRVGTVNSVGEGILVRGCVAETTIPVFPGMSGSPAIIWGAFDKVPLVFGLVSSDPEESNIEVKDDFTRPGHSQVSMLDIERLSLSEGRLEVGLRIGPIAAAIGHIKTSFSATVEGSTQVEPSLPNDRIYLHNTELENREVAARLEDGSK